MRRRAVAERPQEEAEPRLGLLRADPEHGEDAALDVGTVDPHAARAQLPPVQDQVVGLGAHRRRIALQPIEVVGVGHGEGMVGGHRVPVAVDPLEEGEVHDPGEAERTLAHRAAPEDDPKPPEHGAHRPVLVCHHQDQVTGDRPGGRHQADHIVVGEEASQRAVETGPSLAGDRPEPRQALRPELLCLVGQLVEARSGRATAAFDDDPLHTRGGERPDLGPGEGLGQVDELHAETEIGLVGAEPVHCVRPRQPLDLRRSGARGTLRRVEDSFGDERKHVLLTDERRLDVELGC